MIRGISLTLAPWNLNTIAASFSRVTWYWAGKPPSRVHPGPWSSNDGSVAAWKCQAEGGTGTSGVAALLFSKTRDSGWVWTPVLICTASGLASVPTKTLPATLVPATWDEDLSQKVRGKNEL